MPQCMDLHTPYTLQCFTAGGFACTPSHGSKQEVHTCHSNSRVCHSLTQDHNGSLLAAAFVTPCNQVYWSAITETTLQQQQSVQLQWLQQLQESNPVTDAVCCHAMWGSPHSVGYMVHKAVLIML